MSSDKKIILVSGANQGIGYECVRLLSTQQPNSVIFLGSRTQANADEAIKKMGSPANVRSILLDVTSASSIAAAVSKVKADCGHLDVLIQNAGIAIYEPSHEAAVKTFATNVFGVKSMHEAFLPLLPQPNGREIIVSSEVGAWAHHLASKDTQAKLEAIDTLQWPELNSLIEQYIASTKEPYPNADQFPDQKAIFGSYGTSKMFLSVYGRMLARDLTPKGVAVVLATPGYCATNLNNFGGPRSAETGAKSVLQCIDVPLKDSGKLFLDNEVHPVSAPIPDWLKH